MRMFSHHNGQICAAGSRIFVQEGIYDRFIQAFAGAAQSIQLGDGFKPETQQGPLVSEAQLKVRFFFSVPETRCAECLMMFLKDL